MLPHLRATVPASRLSEGTLAEDELEVTISNKVVFASPGDARGVPIVGAAAGVIRGTDPLGELLRRER